ncbi:MAG: THUMP-like domain-containing protein, partial [Angustibacter sp.]
THEVLGGTRQRPDIGPVGTFLFEPDPAIIAAALVGEVAATLGLTAIEPTIAYLSGNRPVNSPLVKSYSVEEIMPYHLKSLRATLRNRDIGPLTIKKRGTSIDPVFLRRQLRLTGSAEATIALTTISGRPHVLFLRALP